MKGALCSYLWTGHPIALFRSCQKQTRKKEETSAYKKQTTLLNHFGSFLPVLSTPLSLALVTAQGEQRTQIQRTDEFRAFIR